MPAWKLNLRMPWQGAIGDGVVLLHNAVEIHLLVVDVDADEDGSFVLPRFVLAFPAGFSMEGYYRRGSWLRMNMWDGTKPILDQGEVFISPEGNLEVYWGTFVENVTEDPEFWGFRDIKEAERELSAYWEEIKAGKDSDTMHWGDGVGMRLIKEARDPDYGRRFTVPAELVAQAESRFKHKMGESR